MLSIFNVSKPLLHWTHWCSLKLNLLPCIRCNSSCKQSRVAKCFTIEVYGLQIQIVACGGGIFANNRKKLLLLRVTVMWITDNYF